METKQKQTDMLVRSREVWFGFTEKMFMFSLAKSRKLVF